MVLYMNLIMHIYIAQRPMQTRLHNWLHWTEETVILAVCLHMLPLTDWIADDEQFKLDIGWSIIIIIATHIALVYIWLLLQVLNLIGLLLLKYVVDWRVWAVRAFGYRIG